MTLPEIYDAIKGFYELEEERHERYLEGVRLISYYAAAPHLPKKAKVKSPKDLFPLRKDAELKRERLKRMKPAQRIVLPKK